MMTTGSFPVSRSPRYLPPCSRTGAAPFRRRWVVATIFSRASKSFEIMGSV